MGSFSASADDLFRAALSGSKTASQGAEDVKPGSGSKGRNSPKAKAGAKKEPPRPGSGKSDASAKQATPAKPTPKPKGKAKPEVVEAEEPVPEPEPVPDPEPECPVYGVARFTLHRLAAGDLNVKLKANVLPVTHMKVRPKRGGNSRNTIMMIMMIVIIVNPWHRRGLTLPKSR